MFLISFPLLALPAYALFGSVSRLFSRRAGQDVRPSTQTAVGGLDSLVNLSTVTPEKGNSVKLLIDGQETFDAVFAAIDAAEDEILIQFYIIRSDAVGLKMQDLLIQAARRGVRVRVL